MTLAAMLLAPLLAFSGSDPLAACLAALQKTPAARRVTAETWHTHTAGLTVDSTMLRNLNTQPEFTMPIWDYVAVMADDERVADGQRMLAQHRTLLDGITARYKVDPAILLALWGIESNYGRGMGAYPVIQSLATLSCAGRRQTYFRTQLLAALRIVQAGHIDPSQFNGSWAGAFGHTQFMPGTFEWLAVDHNGDGRKDVLGNVGDALASSANYLRNAKWTAGLPWGFEVRLPTRSDAAFPVKGEGRRTKRPLSTWVARGVTRVDGSPLVNAKLPASTRMGLHTPAGAKGPAFLVTTNFDAIYRYNAAESYALSIAHLADRIRGGGALATPWPTDDPGLSRADRRELQTLLMARGHAIGSASAILTPATLAAVRAEHQRLGWPASARPGQNLLRQLRSERR